MGGKIMYTVFLVEDEVLVREGIKRIVAWADYGFKFIGEAPDGEIALPKILKLKPEILITDIKMPFLDGLELSKLVKKELPKTTIIILSGYDEFAYAQEAIRIGVSRYLLKPLSKDGLVDALLDIKKAKDQEIEDESWKLKQKEEDTRHATRILFDSLIYGSEPVPTLLDRARSLGIDLSAESFNIVLCICDKPPDIAGGQSILPFGSWLGVSAFLVKGPSHEIDAESDKCMSLCVDLKCEKGTPVSRLSELPASYSAAKRALFGEAPADSSKYSDIINSAMKFIEQRFTYPDLDLISAASAAGVTPTHLSAMFSKETGKTFIEHVTALRMDKARKLLRTTSLASGEIAYKTGYNDPHYFSYAFKKINGVTPTEYRKAKDR
jgi:two-component system response regulator YesN